MKAKIGIGFNILSIIFLINVSGCTKAVETIKVPVLTTSSICNTSQTTSISGGKMKETGFLHWDDPNTDATNSSGFTALEGGGRYGFCSGLCLLSLS